MSATLFIPGLRRALGALAGVFAFSLVVASTAFAANGNGCDAPGNAFGHDKHDQCEAASAPASADPATPAAEPAADPAVPPPAPTEEPSVPAPEALPEEQPAPASELPEPAPADGPTEASTQPEATPAAAQPDVPAPPAPNPAAGGWAPVVARPERSAADPAPRPSAARRTFSSAAAPEASWSTPDASWSQGRADAIDRYGVTGTSAIIALRRGAGVMGGLAFRVQMSHGHSTFAFRASRSIVAGGGGRLYRIAAWLRSDVPGLSVCLRIQEVSPRDTVTPVRTSESCLAPTVNWKRFKLYRRTLARGNRLVFSIYSYGAVAGDSFDVDGFTVSRRVKNGWRRVSAVFGKPTDA